MASKPTTAAAPAAVNPREAIVEALMRLAAEQPWTDIEITDIAREAGVSLAEFRDLFPSKGAVLGGFSRMIDKKVLEGTTDDLVEEPARERLFDVLMRRLDAMAPYRTALRRIVFALRTDPLSLVALNGVALNSQRFMLAAAGIDTEGPLGRLKLQGAVIAFARTLETWLEDDDPSLARTMARLDREIRNGERLMERAEDLRRLTAPLRALGRSLITRGSRRARRPARDVADDDRLDGDQLDGDRVAI
ncbi:TetR family transcriptional regulator [Methylobacterium nodulans]|uniref:Regulatory protein TetR n=1 Tax=Methylobacterium nodulans (strain LMG 21967 / CNCM I-2342 / ORS 2060) TaxID=460265 RepID=B8IM16_METNO|nr:TetR family transcriptional regulator [Methylobacterium nodulans]ACL56360.1 regulatory protein TetR [Methylobacterium nodulans ORS 2060]